MAKRSTRYFKRKDFRHYVLRLCSCLFKLLDFHRKNICVLIKLLTAVEAISTVVSDQWHGLFSYSIL